MVCGNRFNDTLDKKTLHGSLYYGNKFLSLPHFFLIGINLNDPLTGLRVIRAETLRDWSIKLKVFDIEIELNHRVKRKG